MLPPLAADLTIVRYASTNLNQYIRTGKLTRFQSSNRPLVHNIRSQRYSTSSGLNRKTTPSDESVYASSSSTAVDGGLEGTSKFAAASSTQDSVKIRRNRSLIVRPRSGMENIVDFFVILNELERRYGTIDQFRIQRDKDVDHRLLPYFFVSFKSIESIKDVVDGDSFTVPKPVVSREDPGAISLEDLSKYLEPVPIEEHGSKRVNITKITEPLVEKLSSSTKAVKRARGEQIHDVLEVQVERANAFWESLSTETREPPKLSIVKHRALAHAYLHWGGFHRDYLDLGPVKEGQAPMEGHVDTHRSYYQFNFARSMETAQGWLVDEDGKRTVPRRSGKERAVVRDRKQSDTIEETEFGVAKSPSVTNSVENSAESWNESEEDILVHLERTVLSHPNANANASKAKLSLPEELAQTEEFIPPPEPEIASSPSPTSTSSSSQTGEILPSEPTTPLSASSSPQIPPQIQPSGPSTTKQNAVETKPKSKPKPKPKPKSDVGLWLKAPKTLKTSNPADTRSPTQHTENKDEKGSRTLTSSLTSWMQIFGGGGH